MFHKTMIHQYSLKEDRLLPMRRPRSIPRGFTLVELLVGFAVVTILLSLTMRGVQHARETSRRMTCQSKLQQMAIATHNYESQHRHFPMGTSHKIDLLPFLGETAIYESLSSEDNPGAGVRLDLYLCASDPGQDMTGGNGAPYDDGGGMYGTNYHGNAGNGVLAHGFNGVFGYGEDYSDIYPSSATTTSAIADGLSNTALFAEAILPSDANARVAEIWALPDERFEPEELSQVIADCDSLPRSPEELLFFATAFARGFPWQGGGLGTALYTHSLTPNRPSCTNGPNVATGVYTAASMHPGGINVAYCDGHVEFVTQSIDSKAWQDLGSRCPGVSLYQF